MPTPFAEAALEKGWSVDLGDRGLGDILLGLAGVRAMLDACAEMGRTFELRYRGPRPKLLARCRLPLVLERRPGRHVVTTGTADPLGSTIDPEQPPSWLDEMPIGEVEVHSALPMRYYLDIEQRLGIRLPAQLAPAPTFAAGTVAPRRFHVVFVTTTSMPQRKDYGWRGFAAVATSLMEQVAADWHFTVLASPDAVVSRPLGELPHDVLVGAAAVDCLDVFASAELVVGNDTGLTHLAALCERPDGTGPQVIGLYGRHGYAKWTTGARRHHSVATRFSQMMAAADGCPVRDRLDDEVWGAASSLVELPANIVARFAIERAGWRR